MSRSRSVWIRILFTAFAGITGLFLGLVVRRNDGAGSCRASRLGESDRCEGRFVRTPTDFRAEREVEEEQELGLAIRWSVVWAPTLALAICATIVSWLFLTKEQVTLGRSVLALLTYVSSLTIPYWSAWSALEISFRKRKPTTAIVRILASYISVATCYSFYFFASICVADYNDAVSEKNWYRTQLEYVEVLEEPDVYPRPESEVLRAFDGLSQRMWSSVAEEAIQIRGELLPAAPSPELREVVNMPTEDLIEFQPQHFMPLFVDAVYCSLTSLSGLGSGRVTPRTSQVKMAVAIESLVGVTLLVVALGFTLSGVNVGRSGNLTKKDTA